MYRFKLEVLLNHRRHQEEVCQKELAQARRKLADEQEKLDQKKKEKRANVQKLRIKQKENTTVSDIILHVNYIQQLTQDIAMQLRCVQEAANKVHQKRDALIVSMKKRKTLEKLDDKERQAYEQKLIQDELKSVDEFASIRHARKI